MRSAGCLRSSTSWAARGRCSSGGSRRGCRFPCGRAGAGASPVVWTAVRYRAILATLHHPIYAGAYVFGRTETRRELDPEDPHRLRVRRGRRPRDRWPVLIRDHHPGYISFGQYLLNQERMRDNEAMSSRRDEGHQGAAREGRALLQGLVRCGQCGRRMIVGYGGASARRTLQYRCRRPGEYGRRECQLVGGKRVEAAVVETFLEVTATGGAEAAALADEQLREEIAAAETAWRLQIEQAEYEAQRAERQYMAVEPEHRTVARELERRWNQRLEELEAVRAKAAGALEPRRPLTEAERERAQQLGRHLEEVWGANDDDGPGSETAAALPDRGGPAARGGHAVSGADRVEGRRHHGSGGAPLPARGPRHRHAARDRRAGAEAGAGV